MKIDFHTHGKLAKKLPFSREYTNWLFQEGKRAGLDAICLTEHFNTVGFEELYTYIPNSYIREGDSFLCEGLRVFPGMEVDIREGGHILILGKMEEILGMNRELTPYKERGKFISMAELITMAKRYRTLLGAAHAYRQGSAIPTLPRELLTQLDFIDLNGKDIAAHCEETKALIFDFADDLGLPVLAGSDTHQSFQYGCICNMFEKECRYLSELEEEIENAHYLIQIAENAAFQVETAGVLKKSLKEIHALGGDYVKVLVG